MSQTSKMFPSWLLMPVAMGGSVIAGFITFKKSFGTQKYKGDEQILGKTAIVTGANTGIGYEVAREFAKRGAAVIMGCRDMEKCDRARDKIIKETFNRRVKSKRLDLASIKSIKTFAEEVKKEEKFIDILVNNAGIMRCPKTLTSDGFEMQLGVNYLGHFLLTNLLLDRLIESGASRIINVTGATYSKGKINFDDLNSEKSYDPKEAYNQSKLALMMFTRELAYRLKDTKVRSYAVHPGIVRTDINRYTSFGQSWFSQTVLFPFIWIVSMTPVDGAQVILTCALSPELANQSGLYYRDTRGTDIAEVAKDRETSKRLWATSEVWTKLQEMGVKTSVETRVETSGKSETKSKS